ncbi:hypothetical protein Vretimale_9443, partial [Volvox reticuliferus]
GSCGHDFCKHCIEEWKVSRQLVGQAVLCPICRAVLLPSAEQSFGVCIRLRETIEKLFPEQVAMRRHQAVLGTQAHKCAAFPLLPSSPSSSLSTSTSGTSTDSSTATTSNTATTNSSDPMTATATTSSGSPVGSLDSPSSGGGAPGPPGPATPFPLLDLDLLSRAAEQYRELSLLVSAITSVPPPPASVVQAFTHAAASMADHVSSRPGFNGALPTAAAPLQTQQAAELAQLFLSSGAALTSTAAEALQQQQQHQHSLQQQQQQSYAQPYSQMHRQDSPFILDPAAGVAAVARMSGADAAASAAMAAQLAASAAAPSGGVSSGGAPAPVAVAARNAGFLEAALTLLTSAAATSTAAGQLRTLVSTLHHQQQAAAAETGSRGSAPSDGVVAQGAAAMAASNAAGDMLRMTANTVQQLTAEAAAVSQLLRIHHQQQLQAHMQAASQAQAAVQAQQVLQLHAAQQQAQVQYLGPYLMAAGPLQAAPPLPPQPQLTPPHMLISWANGLTATAATGPVIVLGASPTQQATQQPHNVYSVATAAGNQQAYVVTPPYSQLPYTSAPVATASSAAAVSAAAPAVELYGWGQAVGTGNHQDAVTGSTWPAGTITAGSQGPLCYPLTAAHVRFQSTQPYMAVATTAVDGGSSSSSGGLQPMQVSVPDHLLESSANATAPLSPHSRQQRQQALIPPQQQQHLGQQQQQQQLLLLRQQAQAQAATRAGAPTGL